MERILATRVRSVKPSGIRRFFDLIAGMEDVISLGVGEPHFSTPWHICEAAVHAFENGFTSYTPNAGLPELREEVALYLARECGVEYDPQKEIIITVGVSEGLDLALRALVDTGDEVLIPEPCYVSYVPCTVFAGGVPRMIPTSFEEGFKLTPEGLRKALTPRSKVLILANPNNPTGVVMSEEELRAVAEVVEERDLIVIADEIYAELTYDVKHVSFASLPGMRERTVLLRGFSKAFAMTGWRVGYACGPAEIIEAMLKIHQYVALCAPTPAQVGALEALRNGRGELLRMRQQYDRCRRVLVDGLNELGLKCIMPQGAFYAFPKVGHLGMSSEEFSERLLLEERVAVVPGNVFGQSGEGFVRCSFATSMDNLTEALERIERFLRKVR
ncbi:MAG TPA: aminotransferase class I/II-fold pyridoxal phosphate-dependent enzyme [Armatimonadetes bacterium]|nr:aminotransferase class I/II-fold pyridoxal phosphate-dependent enzyme [Armatimonadota bacterium]